MTKSDPHCQDEEWFKISKEMLIVGITIELFATLCENNFRNRENLKSWNNMLISEAKVFCTWLMLCLTEKDVVKCQTIALFAKGEGSMYYKLLK